MKREGWVTSAKAKIDVLRAEAVRVGANRLTRAGEIAAALGIKPSAFSEYFGDNANTNGSRPPRTHLAEIARKYTTIGVVVEIEWFFKDQHPPYGPFTRRLVKFLGRFA